MPQQKPETPPASAPAAVPAPTAVAASPTPTSTSQPEKESPILLPQSLPPRPQQQQKTRQGSPLKNQITATPSKSPPSLRPAPPKSVPSAGSTKDMGIPLTDWARTPQLLPGSNGSRATVIQGSNFRPSPATPQVQQNRTTSGVVAPVQENGVRQPL